MELSQGLLRMAYRRPHVVLAEASGGALVRFAAERELARRGWPVADGPAEADVLLVCGRPGRWAADVDRVFDQMPGPRSRVEVADPQDLPRALDRARLGLLDGAAQRRDATGRAVTATSAGLSMADTGPDRDGLALDVLHVQLGPVLRWWPAGLVARLALQGDVVVDAELEALEDEPDPLDPLVSRLDRAASVLALAGAGGPARGARRLRDQACRGEDVGLARLRHAVGRDRLLRWSLHGLPAIGAGDLWSQLLALLADDDEDGGGSWPCSAAAEALRGAQVTAVRLALAAAPRRSVRGDQVGA